MDNRQTCPCCGYLTLHDQLGDYELCPVCFWEDDPTESEDPLYGGGANGISLTEAQQTYRRIGATHPAFLEKVRAPRPHELPPPD